MKACFEGKALRRANRQFHSNVGGVLKLIVVDEHSQSCSHKAMVAARLTDPLVAPSNF